MKLTFIKVHLHQNSLSPIDFIDDGILIFFSLKHFIKIPSLNDVIETGSSKTTSFKYSHNTFTKSI